MKRNLSYLAPLAIGTLCWFACTATVPAEEQPAPSTQTPVPPPPQAGDTNLFVFGGGTPRQLAGALQRHFHVDWLSIVTIPSTLEQVEVPRIRLSAQSAGEVLKLYNRLADQNRLLGKWYWEGDEAKPAVLMLAADPTVASSLQPERKPTFLEVIPLGDLPEAKKGELDQIVTIINRVWSVAQESGNPEQHSGEKHALVIDQRTQCLVVSGSTEFVNAAKTTVRALQFNAHLHPRF